MALSEPRPANRLISETSPYLLQHAHNPVDWYPWGPEALARARAEDKPILLSVGYSACHWCHVMAHESFEDDETAALMNEWFINIKVDREERPDIDAIYMEAVQTMTGRGGWPMTVFLTADGRPFYGGTYFPTAPRYGMPSFRQLLAAIADAWKERRGELESAGDRLGDALRRSAAFVSADAPLDSELLDRAIRGLLRALDPVEGGFGQAPKFPQPMNLDFLLQAFARSRDPGTLQAVTLTLAKMAKGGIYDQLGGGFHRYSTDARWLVPHFEKMLYDNAQLARTYLHAWQLTGREAFRRIVTETLDYVLREMTSPDGAFYSTQDADSEGQEGKFFLWSRATVVALLGEEDARLFCAVYDVTGQGNFTEGGSGANILHVARELPEVAREQDVSLERVAGAVARGRQILFSAREERVHPGRDDKILAEWNGLMVHALAEAGAVLDRPDYVSAAQRAAGFLLSTMSKTATTDHSHGLASTMEDGPSMMGSGQSALVVNPQSSLRLYRTYNAGRAHLNACLEDYAAVAVGLVALYQSDFDARWLRAADALARTVLDHFLDAQSGGFFQTSDDHEHLVARRKDFVDSAAPSGNSMVAELFLRLGVLLDKPEYTDHATATMRLMADAMGAQPGAFGRMLGALDMYLNPGFEIAIVGDPEAEDTRALLTEARRSFLPNSVLALERTGDEATPALVPLLADRKQVNGRATAYVCRHYACRLPVTDARSLAAQLASDM
jgi:uncharacterized protein YyaL (SSP411 family)